jgi:hypothetical protein
MGYTFLGIFDLERISLEGMNWIWIDEIIKIIKNFWNLVKVVIPWVSMNTGLSDLGR